MNILSQEDKRWANIKIGKTNLTIGSDGCLLTCLAMMSNKTPDIVNSILTAKGAINAKGQVVHIFAAKALGLKFDGIIENPKLSPTYITVMETNNYAPKYPQHFVVWLGDGRNIIDPLRGEKVANKYPITGWRLYHS